jgi:hypothetical protein
LRSFLRRKGVSAGTKPTTDRECAGVDFESKNRVVLSEAPMDFDHKSFLESIAQLRPEEQRERLIAERDRIHAELTEIKEKIAQAKITHIRSGRKADQDWWTRINAAAQVKGHQLLKLQGALTKVTKEVKRQNVEASEQQRRTYERRFITAALQILPRATFDQIAGIAERSTDSEESNAHGLQSDTEGR